MCKEDGLASFAASRKSYYCHFMEKQEVEDGNEQKDHLGNFSNILF